MTTTIARTRHTLLNCLWLLTLTLIPIHHACANVHQTDDDTTTPQESTLPVQGDFSVTLNGGLGIANKGKNGFVDLHNKTSMFVGQASAHYNIIDDFAVGLNYTFIGSHSGKDLLRCHFIAPSLKLCPHWDDDRQSAYLAVAPGRFNYADRTYTSDHTHKTDFQKNYFAISFQLGYECVIYKKLYLNAAFTVLTAKWHTNDKYEVFRSNSNFFDSSTTSYNPGHEPEYLFEPSQAFVALGIGVGYRF